MFEKNKIPVTADIRDVIVYLYKKSFKFLLKRSKRDVWKASIRNLLKRVRSHV